MVDSGTLAKAAAIVRLAAAARLGSTAVTGSRVPMGRSDTSLGEKGKKYEVYKKRYTR